VKKNDISKRQEELLLLILNEHIQIDQPISSNYLLNKYNLNYSSATIRNDMQFLENQHFLEKTHLISGGRIPTTEAYRHYVKSSNSISVFDKKNNDDIFNRLEEILNKRQVNKKYVLEETTRILSEITNMYTYISEENEKELLEDKLDQIEIHQISQNKAILILKTINNNVINNVIDIENELVFKDIKICIAIFNANLLGVRIEKIQENALKLKKIIEQQVTILEIDLIEIIKKIFDIFQQKTIYRSGYSNLINKSEKIDLDLLKKIFKILENNSIWDLIDKEKIIRKNGTNLAIGINDEISDYSLITKNVVINDKKHSITFFGSKRTDYNQITQILDWLDRKFEEME